MQNQGAQSLSIRLDRTARITMIDTDLIEELDAASARMGCITRLAPDIADVLVKRISNAYVNDCGSLRWWESLKTPVERISYGHADGLSRLETLVGHQDDVILIVTDEENPPWPVYAGRSHDLIAVLRNCRFFEYMLAARDGSWLIFDTHLNELLRVLRRNA